MFSSSAFNLLIVIYIFGQNSTTLAASSFKFTNLKCFDHDVEFSRFEKCKLSVVKRGVISLHIRVGLYKSPVTNSTVNLAVYKRANGYRPFLYNITQDICAFFANRKRFPIMKVILDIFLKESNLNHTCPYYEFIEVKDLVLHESAFSFFPIPEGEYMLKIRIFAYNDLKATTEIYVSRRD